MYKKSRTTERKIDFYILDLVLFAASYLIGYLCRFGFQIVSYLSDVIVRFGVILLIIYFLVALVTRAYKNILLRNKWIELISTVAQVGITLIIFLMYLYVTKQSEALARMMFVYMAASAVILIWVCRCIYKYILRKHYRNNSRLSHLLVVADEENASSCVQTIQSQHFNDFYLCGVVVRPKDISSQTGFSAAADAVNEISGCQIVCSYENIREYVLSNVVDEVMLAIADDAERQSLSGYFLEAGIAVHLSLDDQKTALPNVMTEYVGGKLVLTASNNVASGLKLGIKRAVDILGGLVGMLITGILYIFVAPQIKRKDPGSAFFKQERVGKNGRVFQIYKFRSMFMDADSRKGELASKNEMDGMMFKIEDDPRIIPGIGQSIRRSSIDEFPQFWNVFKGDMSLVGTRPPTLDEFEKYEAHHKSRLSFRPGLTGLWQVSGRNRITDFEEIVRLDNEYISNWSLWLDVKLIIRTIGVVISRKGSM